MPTHPALNDLYAEWRRLTEAEGEAITGGQWQLLAAHQQRKQSLKLEIVDATQVWHTEWPQTETRQTEYERRFRPLVDELIQLESRNHELLCQRRRRVESELAELDRSRGQLRGVQRAYAGQASSWWQSYS
jgi:hypothetical protein